MGHIIIWSLKVTWAVGVKNGLSRDGWAEAGLRSRVKLRRVVR